jgi:AcrR family transcriptional regulator
MARRRHPDRLDRIVAAATDAFTNVGYARAKIHRIAEDANISSGTIYLYVSDKESLFELALFRALESPLVADPTLPYQKSAEAQLEHRLVECLREITHFPQLWVAMQRRSAPNGREEYIGILLEISRWIRRYRAAILLAERNQLDWPLLAAEFSRVVWTDLHQRLTSYLGHRMRAGLLIAAGDPALIARVTLDALVAALVTGPLTLPIDRAAPDEDAVVAIVAAALVGSGDGLPLPPHQG